MSSARKQRLVQKNKQKLINNNNNNNNNNGTHLELKLNGMGD
jgi:hypothetical protein